MFIIRKNTYSIKEDLKKVGCKWNAIYKCWVFPNEKATKGFKFEVIESFDNLEVPKEKLTKHFKPSCITLNGVIISQHWVRGRDKREIHEFKVIGKDNCEGKIFIFNHSPYKYTQGEILENIPCKIMKSYGNFVVIDKILEL